MLNTDCKVQNVLLLDGGTTHEQDGSSIQYWDMSHRVSCVWHQADAGAMVDMTVTSIALHGALCQLPCEGVDRNQDSCLLWGVIDTVHLL